jgi:hypothetical protein
MSEGNRKQSSSTVSSAESAASPTSSQSGMDSSSGVSCASSPGVQTPLSALPVPPGLGSVSPRFTSWADDIPPGLFPDIIVNNAQSSLPPLDDFAPGIPITPNHPDVPDNIEEAFAELQVADPTQGYVSPWECADNQQVKIPEIPAVSGSLWDDYEEEKPAPVQGLLCTDHGRICKKGICKTYAKQLRDIERAKKDAERAKKMAENPKGDRGRGKGLSGGRGGRGGSNNNWRDGPRGGQQENNRPPVSGHSRSNSKSSGTNTPLNASSTDDDDDDDRFSVASGSKGSKRSRPRANSIESAASSANGWGTFSNGPW